MSKVTKEVLAEALQIAVRDMSSIIKCDKCIVYSSDRCTAKGRLIQCSNAMFEGYINRAKESGKTRTSVL